MASSVSRTGKYRSRRPTGRASNKPSSRRAVRSGVIADRPLPARRAISAALHPRSGSFRRCAGGPKSASRRRWRGACPNSQSANPRGFGPPRSLIARPFAFVGFNPTNDDESAHNGLGPPWATDSCLGARSSSSTSMAARGRLRAASRGRARRRHAKCGATPTSPSATWS